INIRLPVFPLAVNLPGLRVIQFDDAKRPLQKPPHEQMEMRKQLAFMETTLARLPFDPPKTASGRRHTAETLCEIVHPNLCRLREPCDIIIECIIRQCGGDEIRKPRSSRDLITTVDHPTTRTKREPLAAATWRPVEKLFVVPLHRRRRREPKLDEATTFSEAETRLFTREIPFATTMRNVRRFHVDVERRFKLS